MRAYAVDSKHEERKHDTLSELGYVEYILQAGEQGLYYLCLTAGGLYFLKSALAELVGAHG